MLTEYLNGKEVNIKIVERNCIMNIVSTCSELSTKFEIEHNIPEKTWEELAKAIFVYKSIFSRNTKEFNLGLINNIDGKKKTGVNIYMKFLGCEDGFTDTDGKWHPFIINLKIYVK